MSTHNTSIESCIACMIACEQCLTDCIESQREDCAEMCRDCADICALTARMQARNSPFRAEFSALCAMVCGACAETCEQHAMHDDSCRACAQACRQCAAVCNVVVEECVWANSSMRGEVAFGFLPFSFYGYSFSVKWSSGESLNCSLVWIMQLVCMIQRKINSTKKGRGKDFSSPPSLLNLLELLLYQQFIHACIFLLDFNAVNTRCPAWSIKLTLQLGNDGFDHYLSYHIVHLDAWFQQILCHH